MFETIGTDPDPERAARRGWALLLTGSTTAAIGSAIALATFLAVGGTVPLPDPVDLPLPVLVEDDDLARVDLGLPAPPPVARGVAAEPNTAPTPDTPPDQPAPLTDAPPDRVADPAGDPNGDAAGDPQGAVGGTGSTPGAGPCVGPACGGGGPPVVALHHSALTVKRQVAPVYPGDAPDQGDVRCVAIVRIDEAGVPFHVSVAPGCPPAFVGETEAALARWRWYPPRVGKAATRAETRIGVTYRKRDR